MSTATPASMPCRYCRADNLVGSRQCWLCDAPDWSPTLTSPLKPPTRGARPAPPRTGVNPKAMIGALGLTLLIVGWGLGSNYLGLAVLVSVIWWATIGYTVARWGRFEPTDVAFTLVRAIVGMAAVAGLLVAAVIVFIFVICFTDGTPNFH